MSLHSRFRDECLSDGIFDGPHDSEAITISGRGDHPIIALMARQVIIPVEDHSRVCGRWPGQP